MRIFEKIIIDRALKQILKTEKRRKNERTIPSQRSAASVSMIAWVEKRRDTNDSEKSRMWRESEKPTRVVGGPKKEPTSAPFVSIRLYPSDVIVTTRGVASVGPYFDKQIW